jgi:hypothetical protein
MIDMYRREYHMRPSEEGARVKKCLVLIVLLINSDLRDSWVTGKVNGRCKVPVRNMPIVGKKVGWIPSATVNTERRRLVHGTGPPPSTRSPAYVIPKRLLQAKDRVLQMSDKLTILTMHRSKTMINPD